MMRDDSEFMCLLAAHRHVRLFMRMTTSIPRSYLISKLVQQRHEFILIQYFRYDLIIRLYLMVYLEIAPTLSSVVVLYTDRKIVHQLETTILTINFSSSLTQPYPHIEVNPTA